MKLTSNELKALYQEQTSRSGRRRESCLSEETLLHAAAGTLSRRERKQVADHLVTCSDCVEEFRLARSLRPWAEDAAASFGDPSLDAKTAIARAARPAWLKDLLGHLVPMRRWRVAVAASTIVLAVGAGVALWRAGLEIVPGERAGAGVDMNVDPADGAVLPQPPPRLAWSAPESADRYQVVLYDFESTPIWEGPSVTSSPVTIPETVRDRLPRGRPIYWRVVAYRGVDRVQSTVFQFVIAP